MPMSRTITLVATVLCVLTALSARAQQGAAVSWALELDNDKWGDGADRHYTAGTHLIRRSDQSPSWLRRVAAPLRCLACRAPRQFELELGQEIYTPENTRSSRLVVDDRPYAGWAFGRVTLFGERQIGASRRRTFDTLAAELGVVGPASLAERMQTQLHRDKGVVVPRGWSHQLHDEVGADVTYVRGVRWTFGRSRLRQDVAPYVMGTLGTMHDEVGGGVKWRGGGNLERSLDLRSTGWHVFIDLNARFVERNVLLDGNRDGQSHSVQKEPVVTRVGAGVEYAGRRVRMTVGRERTSREFIGQREPDEYGAVTFSAGRR